MSETMREIVFALAAEKSEQESVLISLDIEDDKLFLLHFIIGTYFGPDLRNHRKKSGFQIKASNLPTKDELTGSFMKRAELERVYHYILNNADPSLIVKRKILLQYFNGKRSNSDEDFPLFRDLYPQKLHRESRLGNQYKLFESIVFINDPDTSCMREDCVERFKRLTGMQSFTLSLVVEPVAGNEVEDKIDESMEPSKEDSGLEVSVDDNAGTCTSDEECDVAANPDLVVDGAIAGAQAGQVMGLMDIGDFSCQVEENGRVLVRGITTTGEKEVHRYTRVFEMQTQNLCPPGHFSVSFHLPGPVHPHEFSGRFGTDGILEGVVMKKLKKQNCLI
ncbi:increased DNA methylation 2 isoform X2 [Eutrema salsugineum]|uniref:increased DNA methylation 2 isoform X2 n=1 Tax=Eutrema salsugineum TaxID=72664 RepID=UPI000CED02B7|nr:increased DNA methylation 2 isoform X2 [Eutrema salsugineum]